MLRLACLRRSVRQLQYSKTIEFHLRPNWAEIGPQVRRNLDPSCAAVGGQFLPKSTSNGIRCSCYMAAVEHGGRSVARNASTATSLHQLKLHQWIQICSTFLFATHRLLNVSRHVVFPLGPNWYRCETVAKGSQAAPFWT